MNITIVIKTFKRKKSLWRLLHSIELLYPNIPIIILDDSKNNYKEITLKKFPKLDILYIITEFDIGLSKGRNILIENVKTEYFILCDDDFEFDERTNIYKAYDILVNEKADIVGGKVYNIFKLDSIMSLLWILKRPSRFIDVLNKKEIISIYNGKFNIHENSAELVIDKNYINYDKNKYYETDIVSNFFIAKTKSIKKIKGWQPEEIKVGEHQAFFLRAKKAGLKVLYTKEMGIKHYPYKSIFYSKYRLRSFEMQRLSFKMLGLDSYKTYDTEGKLIFNYKK